MQKPADDTVNIMFMKLGKQQEKLIVPAFHHNVAVAQGSTDHFPEVNNDFGTPGIADLCRNLDSQQYAECRTMIPVHIPEHVFIQASENFTPHPHSVRRFDPFFEDCSNCFQIQFLLPDTGIIF